MSERTVTAPVNTTEYVSPAPEASGESVPPKTNNAEAVAENDNKPHKPVKSTVAPLPEKTAETENFPQKNQESEEPVLNAGNPPGETGEEGENESGPLCALPPAEITDIDEARNSVGYDFKLPKYIPDGYAADGVSVLFGSLVQISYKSEDDIIIYRTEKTDEEDISGDYNQYSVTETENIGGSTVTLKGGDDKFYCAVWRDGDAYSLTCNKGISRGEMSKIIESVEYREKETNDE